eukprot:1451241-Rhodomonas_salina.2
MALVSAALTPIFQDTGAIASTCAHPASCQPLRPPRQRVAQEHFVPGPGATACLWPPPVLAHPSLTADFIV